MQTHLRAVDPARAPARALLATLDGLLDSETIGAAIAIYEQLAAVAPSNRLHASAIAGRHRWQSLTPAPTRSLPAVDVEPLAVATVVQQELATPTAVMRESSPLVEPAATDWGFDVAAWTRAQVDAAFAELDSARP